MCAGHAAKIGKWLMVTGAAGATAILMAKSMNNNPWDRTIVKDEEDPLENDGNHLIRKFRKKGVYSYLHIKDDDKLLSIEAGLPVGISSLDSLRPIIISSHDTWLKKALVRDIVKKASECKSRCTEVEFSYNDNMNENGFSPDTVTKHLAKLGESIVKQEQEQKNEFKEMEKEGVHLLILDITKLMNLRNVEPLRKVLNWVDNHGRRKCQQVLVISSSALGLWPAMKVLLEDQTKQEGGGESASDKPQGPNISWIWLDILGPSSSLLKSLLSDMSSDPPPETEKKQESKEELAAASTPPQDKDYFYHTVEEEDVDQEKQQQQIEDKGKNEREALLMDRFVRLRPEVDNLIEMAEVMERQSEIKTWIQALEHLINVKKEKLLALWGINQDEKRSELEEDSTIVGYSGEEQMVLWSIMKAMHGERLDVLTGPRLRPEGGLITLEVLMDLCQHDLQLLGRFLQEGWLRIHRDVVPTEVSFEKQKDDLEGEEEDQPRHAQDDSAAAVILANATPISLRSTDAYLSSEGTVMISTPALVTLAFKAIAAEAKLVHVMNCKADKLYLLQEVKVLQEQRSSLGAEWEQLDRARSSLEERKNELTAEDFMGLQLDLLRLEKSVASRAWEMQLRHKRFRLLYEQLQECLPAQELPPSGIFVPGGDEKSFVEDQILLDVDQGRRGGPIDTCHPGERQTGAGGTGFFLQRWKDWLTRKG